MLDLYKSLLADQYDAVFCTLNDCLENCSDELWQQPVAELTFNQAAFHVLFFTDVYLGNTLEDLRQQQFHRDHADTFADYEELEPRRQQAVYVKSFIRQYFDHCRQKAAKVVAAETAESLAHRPGFDWLRFSRAEVHVYNIRHVQHHAAQLSLHLRLKTGDGVPWYGSGWGHAWREA